MMDRQQWINLFFQHCLNNCLRLTKVLLQLGLDGRTISRSKNPNFGFSGRNSSSH